MEMYFDEAENVRKEHNGPYVTIEFPTEEDYEAFKDIFGKNNAKKNTYPKWRPLKYRATTTEDELDVEEFPYIFDCELPDGTQTVLVSTEYGVYTDEFIQDVDGCYFANADVEDVKAWMPLPEAYKGEGE